MPRKLDERLRALEARMNAPTSGDWGRFLDLFSAYCKGVFLGKVAEPPAPPQTAPGAIPPVAARARIDKIFGHSWDPKRGPEQLKVNWVGEFLIGLNQCTPDEVVTILPEEDRAIVEKIGSDAYFDWLDTQI